MVFRGGFAVVLFKKEKTWCAALVDFRSQIKYSVAPNRAGSGTDGVAREPDSNGDLNVFNVNRNDDGFWLDDNWTNPSNRWNLDNEFVFRLRKCFLFPRLREVAVFLFRIFHLFFPTPQHSADFVEFGGDLFKMPVGDQFSFPSDGNDEF